jgi:hypothetical protein
VKEEETKDEDIRVYLIELTNQMIEEVCRRVETATPSPVRTEQTVVTPIELSCLAPDG